MLSTGYNFPKNLQDSLHCNAIEDIYIYIYIIIHNNIVIKKNPEQVAWQQYVLNAIRISTFLSLFLHASQCLCITQFQLQLLMGHYHAFRRRLILKWYCLYFQKGSDGNTISDMSTTVTIIILQVSVIRSSQL